VCRVELLQTRSPVAFRECWIARQSRRGGELGLESSGSDPDWPGLEREKPPWPSSFQSRSLYSPSSLALCLRVWSKTPRPRTRNTMAVFVCEVRSPSTAISNSGARSDSAATTFVKFAAARPGEDAPETFARVLDGCEAVAAEAGCGELMAGISTARHQAYRQMLDRGFRIVVSGVTMLRPDAAAFNRPDCFVIDDLR
jgi:hypothetical protein